MRTPKYTEGDWVRFMKNGVLAIGCIEYIKPFNHAYSKQEYVTSEGIVDEASVLECRPPLNRSES